MADPMEQCLGYLASLAQDLKDLVRIVQCLAAIQAQTNQQLEELFAALVEELCDEEEEDW